jgi:hypothetical protein
VRDHPGCEALGETGDVGSDQRFHQPQLDLWRRDRDRLENRRRRRAETGSAREDRVLDCRGELLCTRCEHLDGEERIPSRLREQRVGIDTVRLGETRDCSSGERQDLEAPDGARTRERSEQETQGVRAIDLVVAVAQKNECRSRVEPAAEQGDHVERRLVCPLDVVEYQHGRRARAQLSDECRRHCLGPSSLVDDVCQLAAHRVGHVDERAERPRREQRVGRAPQRPHRAVAVVAESAQ